MNFKKSGLTLFVLLISMVFGYSMVSGYGKPIEYKAVNIIKPANGASISSPVEVCMETFGVQAEPAKMGVNENRGHHHLLIDVDIPNDLSKPIGKDAQHVHMGDGSTCKKLKLSPGKHTIRALFAMGNHVPYDPPLSSMITINVK